MTDEKVARPAREEQADVPPERGQLLISEWSIKWIDPREIEAGSLLAPAKTSGTAGREFAALNMILGDFAFARECFVEADKLGAPNTASTQSKALIFSGVVAYARPFMTTVREVRLEPGFFNGMTPPFDEGLHGYLVDVRSKHVAHSVNEFERCETAAMMVRAPSSTDWRIGGGIGVTQTQSIGLTRDHVQQAVAHTANASAFLQVAIDRKGVEVYDNFKAQFEKDGKWEMVPIARMPDQTKSGKRRWD